MPPEAGYLLLVNPEAGKGRALRKAALMKECLARRGLPFRAALTAGPGSARAIAWEFCRAEGARGVVGVGGDGTMQEIAEGMAGAAGEGPRIPMPLCILPGGSGNDFVAGLGRPPARGPDDLAARLAAGDARAVDVITANGRAFLNIASIGLDAMIVKNAAGLKGKLGRLSYKAAIAGSILSYRPVGLKIETEDKIETEGRTEAGTAGKIEMQGPFTLVAVCNGQFYGGGICIAPRARADDGRITVCAARGATRPRTLALLPMLLMKLHGRMREVSFFKCRELRITPLGESASLCLDGNLHEVRGEIRFRLRPGMLDVIA